MHVLLVPCSRLDGGGDCQPKGCFKYEIDVQVESQNLAINEAKQTSKQKKPTFLGKAMSDLWGERREYLIFLLWYIV